MKRLCLLLMFPLFWGCNSSDESKAISIIESELMADAPKPISKIIYSSLDSVFTSVYNTDAYRKNDKELEDYYFKWKGSKRDCEDQLRTLGKELSKDLVFLYQDRVRECFNEEKELKRKFKSSFKGFVIGQNYKYDTDFGDSIYIAVYELDKTLKGGELQMNVSFSEDEYNTLSKNGDIFDGKFIDDVRRFYNSDEPYKNEEVNDLFRSSFFDCSLYFFQFSYILPEYTNYKSYIDTTRFIH